MSLLTKDYVDPKSPSSSFSSEMTVNPMKDIIYGKSVGRGHGVKANPTKPRKSRAGTTSLNPSVLLLLPFPSLY